MKTSLALLALLVAAVTLPAVAAADLTEPATQKAAAELAVEESAEAGEDAFALPANSKIAQEFPQLAVRMDHLKAFIAHIRESERYTYHLHHWTTRFLVHLPKKREHVHALRERIRMIRALALERRQQTPAPSATSG